MSVKAQAQALGSKMPGVCVSTEGSSESLVCYQHVEQKTALTPQRSFVRGAQNTREDKEVYHAPNPWHRQASALGLYPSSPRRGVSWW